MTTFPGLPIETPRLRLRCVTGADVPALFEIFSHPEVMRYWATPPYTEQAQAAQLVEDIEEGYRTGSLLQLGIERRVDATLLGTCTLFQIHRTCRRAELGYVLGRPHWQQGYMREALRAFLDYAFGTLDLHRVEADLDPRNLASARTVERLGFQREGLLRERWIVNGEVSDTAFYGLLKSEWRG